MFLIFCWYQLRSNILFCKHGSVGGVFKGSPVIAYQSDMVYTVRAEYILGYIKMSANQQLIHNELSINPGPALIQCLADMFR